MQNEISNKHFRNRNREAQSDSLEAPSSNLNSDILPVVERWEQCLAEQVNNYPQLALGASLMVGIALGWWVKR